jgi:hypothetical protein
VRGRITYKAHHRGLALDLWKTNDDGDTWEYLYFLGDLRPQSISGDQLNEAVGYKAGAPVQSLTSLIMRRATSS